MIPEEKIKETLVLAKKEISFAINQAEEIDAYNIIDGFDEEMKELLFYNIIGIEI